MKQTKLFLATLLAGVVMAMPQNAKAGNYDFGYDNSGYFTAATNAIIYGGSFYTISTTYNETTYYLKSDGTLTTNEAEACMFSITQTGESKFKSNSFYVNTGSARMSTSGCSTDEALAALTALQLGANNNDWNGDKRAQVFFLKDGKYAVRSGAKNANGSGNEYMNYFWGRKETSSTVHP